MPDRRILTTESGIPVADNQNSQTSGADGPVLLQDQHLTEKLVRFNRERIPERSIASFRSADPDYGARVETAVKAQRRRAAHESAPTR
jgi:catalase